MHTGAGRALIYTLALTIPVLALAADPVTFERAPALDTLGTEAEFGRTCSVAVDHDGRVFVAD